MLKHSLQKGLECMNVFFTYFRYYKASTVKNIPMLSYTDDEAFRNFSVNIIHFINIV